MDRRNITEGAGGALGHQSIPAADSSSKCAVWPATPGSQAGGGAAAIAQKGVISLTATLENGAIGEVSRAVWLGRVAAVMEARGDQDEAVRLYGQACTELTGNQDDLAGGAMVSTNGVVVSFGHGGEPREYAAAGGGGGGLARVEGTGGAMGSDAFPYSTRAHYLASCIERAYRRHFLR